MTDSNTSIFPALTMLPELKRDFMSRTHNRPIYAKLQQSDTMKLRAVKSLIKRHAAATTGVFRRKIAPSTSLYLCVTQFFPCSLEPAAINHYKAAMAIGFQPKLVGLKLSDAIGRNSDEHGATAAKLLQVVTITMTKLRCVILICHARLPAMAVAQPA